MEDKVKDLIEKAEKLLGELKAHIATPEVTESVRFKTLSDGWVLDKALGIEWGPSSTNRMNWEKAKKYADDKGGRLPTVKELRSLVDYDRANPAIDTAFFADTKTDDWYWTGTQVKAYESCAWCVGFGFGSVSNGCKDYGSYVRPCRSSQSLII
jgi:hypothetical protein